jgi:hypothetical protein
MALITYEDGNRLEDVLRTVVQVTPYDTPFLSYTPKTRAYNTLHEWPEDSLTTRADNAVIEGASFSYGTLTAPARITNVAQIFEKTYNVSSTERWVRGAGVNDQFSYQEMKAVKTLSTDVEHALLRGSRATGNASTARRLAGMLNFVTTNATAVASGTTLSESFFNGMLENCWTSGGDPDCVYTGARLKRVISTYTAGVTKNIQASQNKVINSVETYESDFGLVKLKLSRDMPTTANSNAGVLVCTTDTNYVAIGEPIRILSREEVAQTLHGTNGVMRGELTLEVRAERHNALATGLDTSFV